MFRVLAVAAFIVAVVLFLVVAVGSPANAPVITDWGFVSVASGLLCLCLEGLPLKVG